MFKKQTVKNFRNLKVKLKGDLIKAYMDHSCRFKFNVCFRREVSTLNPDYPRFFFFVASRYVLNNQRNVLIESVKIDDCNLSTNTIVLSKSI